MEDIPQKVEEIVAHAPNWSFEYDMSLLELMKMISQNMQQHASKTSESLQTLISNVERTNVDLDNTANSLTALQFGQQFVESRCVDDDETIEKKAEVPAEEVAPVVNAEELLKSFFNNNLAMLQNCHEKYSIDMQDSDDEDEVTTKTYMFQARNPYNERILPHIYNSNMWKESWHVGLAEDTANDFSGDELSLAYSESSASSISAPADNESFESNNGQLSAWTSSASLPQTQTFQQKVTDPVRSISSRNNTNAAGSDTSASIEIVPTIQKNIQYPKKELMPKHEYDLFAALRTTPPPMPTPTPSATPTPTHSSYSQKQSVSLSSSTSSSNLPNVATASVADVYKSDNTHEQEKTKEPAAAQAAIRRKPVNLFDDDEFNNFMSELTGKTQAQADNQALGPANAANEKSISEPPVAQPRTQNKVVDLFADLTLDFETAASKTNDAAPSRQQMNLFDDFDNEVLASAVSTTATQSKVSVKTDTPKLAPQSLFHDEADEEDDFLSVFNTRSKPTTTLTKTNLFDDDDDDDEYAAIVASNTSSDVLATATNAKSEKSKQNDLPATSLTQQAMPSKILFDDSDESNDDFFANRDLNTTTAVEQLSASKVEANKVTHESAAFGATGDGMNATTNFAKKQLTELFADDNDDDLFAPSKQTKTFSQTEHVVKSNSLPENAENPSSHINAKMAIAEAPEFKPVMPLSGRVFKSEQLPTPVPAKLTLFDDDSDGEDALFKSVKQEQKQKTTNALNPAAFDASTDRSEAANGVATASKENKTVETTKKLSLFDDEAVNDDGDIFAKHSTLPNIEARLVDANVSGTAENVEEAASSAQLVGSIEHNRSESAVLHENVTSGDTAVQLDAKAVSVEKTQSRQSTLDETNTQHSVTATATAKENLVSVPNAALEENVTPKHERTELPQETPAAEHEKPATTARVHNMQSLEMPQAAESVPSALPSNITATAKYSNLFLDEPPDDSDFFMNLSSQTPKRTQERAYDDFFEPALPELPAATLASKQANPATPATQTLDVTSDYKSIRLFSDLPPDDEYDEIMPVSQPAQATTSDAKRLHSIFYDDFSETMEAVKQQHSANKAPEIPKQYSLFDDEPPSDDELFGKPAKAKQDFEYPTKVVANPMTLAAAQDITDNIQPKIEHTNNSNIAALQAKIQSAHGKEQVVKQSKTDVPSVAKLKIKNLNINVQALLPGAAMKSVPRKSNESMATPDVTPPATVSVASAAPRKSTESVATPQIVAAASSAAGNSGILSNVCKTRVRAPANRRSSTRKARQENYRKSMVMEEAEQAQLFENFSTPINEQNLSAAQAQAVNTVKSAAMKSEHNVLMPSTEVNKLSETQAVVAATPAAHKPLHNVALSATHTAASTYNSAVQKPIDPSATPSPIKQAAQENIPRHGATLLFGDSSDEELEELFGRGSSVDKSAPKAALKRPIDAATQHLTQLPTPTTSKPATSTKPTLFDSDTADTDEDKPSSVKPLTTKAVPKAASAVGHMQKSSLFSSSSGEEDDVNSSFAKTLKASKPPTLKPLTKPASSGGLFSDDDEDDDDLFGTGGTKASSTAIPPATAYTVAPKSAQQKSTKAVASKTKSAVAKDSNPLADLLK